MALTCREDRALLESNPSAWQGSAEDSRGGPEAAPLSFSRYPWENKSGKLINQPSQHIKIIYSP